MRTKTKIEFFSDKSSISQILCQYQGISNQFTKGKREKFFSLGLWDPLPTRRPQVSTEIYFSFMWDSNSKRMGSIAAFLPTEPIIGYSIETTLLYIPYNTSKVSRVYVSQISYTQELRMKKSFVVW
jgi:hypothetical protein